MSFHIGETLTVTVKIGKKMTDKRKFYCITIWAHFEHFSRKNVNVISYLVNFFFIYFSAVGIMLIKRGS
jgi:hypothetical protein